MDRSEIIELARRTAAPAVSVLLPVEQPAPAHPETDLRLRALVHDAVAATATWWDAEAAHQVRAQLEDAELEISAEVSHGEPTRGLALFVSPDHHLLLPLPFSVQEEVIVDTTYATRQLFEGIARRPPYLVVVLDAEGGRLFEGEGARVVEVREHGFPVRVRRPVEQDTPHADLPRHESVRDEDRRVVERAVASALDAARRTSPRPVVVVGDRRRVATLLHVADLGDELAGVVHGEHGRDRPDQLAALVRPAVEEWLSGRRARACDRLREAAGRGAAVTTLPEVLAAAAEDRGRELIVEEGFSMPRTWVDGLGAGEGPNPQIDTEDMVDDVIEQVLSFGGEVTFVDRDSLDDCGQIGLLLRW